MRNNHIYKNPFLTTITRILNIHIWLPLQIIRSQKMRNSSVKIHQKLRKSLLSHRKYHDSAIRVVWASSVNEPRTSILRTSNVQDVLLVADDNSTSDNPLSRGLSFIFSYFSYTHEHILTLILWQKSLHTSQTWKKKNVSRKNIQPSDHSEPANTVQVDDALRRQKVERRNNMTSLPYTLIRSSRRSLAIQIDPSGELIVRAPQRMSISVIEDFIMRKHEWIEKHQKKIQNKWQKIEKKNYTEGEVNEMKVRLQRYITHRVRELWEGKNLPPYTNIKITKSEHRWWSCSGKNGLCFSYRLAEYLDREEFIDSIISHELAHLREKHHQKSFWNLVYQMMPEYETIMKQKKISNI